MSGDRTTMVRFPRYVPDARSALAVMERFHRSRPDLAPWFDGPHVAFDPFARVLSASKDLREGLDFKSKPLVGRTLLHRVVGADRVAFTHRLMRLRETKVQTVFSVRMRNATNHRLFLLELSPFELCAFETTTIALWQPVLVDLTKLGA